MALPSDAHGFFDAVQVLAIVGGLIFFVYDRLRLTSTHSDQIEKLDESIIELTKQVSNLASTVGTLQGQFSIWRELKR